MTLPRRRRCPVCSRLLRAEAFARRSRLVTDVCRRCWQGLGEVGKRERLELARVRRADLKRRQPSRAQRPVRGRVEDPEVLARLAYEYRRTGRVPPVECRAGSGILD